MSALPHIAPDLASLVDLIETGAALVDGAGTVVAANASGEALMPVGEEIALVDVAGTPLPLESGLAGTIVGVARPDGTTAWVRASAAPIASNGARLSLLTFADAAAERDRERSAQEAADRVAEITGDLNGFPMTYEVNADGSILALSAGLGVVERMLATPLAGLDDAALLWDARVHPDDRAAHAAFRQTVARGLPGELEYRIVGFDGVERWIWTRDRPHREASGRLRVDGVVFDVTDRHLQRTALDDARDRLRTVLETINEVVFEVLVTPDGSTSVSHAGPGIERLLGGRVGPGENPLAALRARVPRDDQDIYLAHLSDVMRGVDSSIECRVTDDAGVPRWMWIRSRASSEPSGDLRVAVVISDVDDLHAAAEHRDRAELQIRELLASGEDILSIDEILEDGTLVSVYAPPSIHRFYGVPVDAPAVVDRWLRAIHPDDRKRVIAEYARHRELGTLSLEYRIVRGDGSVRTVWDRSRAFLAPNGKWYAAGAMTDVTDHRRFAAASEYLRAISDVARDVLYVDAHRADGTIGNVYESPAGLTFFGPAPEDGDRAARWLRAVLEEDRPQIDRAHAAIAAGQPFTIEYRVRDEAGVVRVVSDSGADAGVRDGVRLVAGIIRDITEQVRLGRLLQERDSDIRAVAHATDEVLYVDHAREDGTFATIFVDDRTHGLYGGTPGGPGYGVDVWVSHIHPDDVAGFHAGIARALAGDPEVSLVYRLVGVDGVTRLVEDRPRAFRAADGRQLVSGTVREVEPPVS